MPSPRLPDRRGRGRSPQAGDSLADRFTPVPGLWDEEPLAPRIAEIASGSFRRRDPPEIRGTGYAVASLEAALWAFDRSSSFREGPCWP